MAKKFSLEKEEVLWKDRKRYFGLPISFTRYSVTKDRFITRIGLFTTETNEILLYRILDVRLVRTLGQKIFRVGTLTLYSADQTNCEFEIKNIAHSEQVRRYIGELVEERRTEKQIAGREIYGVAGMEHEHIMSDADAANDIPSDN